MATSNVDPHLATAADLLTNFALGIFDVQLCGVLKEDWLIHAAEAENITRDELKSFCDEGFVRCWTNVAGETGFLIYTPHQLSVLKQLASSGRYSTAELHHIMDFWDEYLEGVLMHDPDYDDRSVPDLDHYKRRLAEWIEDYHQHLASLEGRENHSAEQENVRSNLRIMERNAERASGWKEASITDRQRQIFKQQLSLLRWVDEWVRFSTAQEFEAKLVQGYSPELFFGKFSNASGYVEFQRIDWRTTLETFKDSRADGHRFPLRTPVFDVSENGIELRYLISPEDYAELYAKYQLADLFKVLLEAGNAIWFPPPKPDQTACRECGKIFTRKVPAQDYCERACRIRAKNRRFRQRDPERVRQYNARYWSSYNED